MRDKKPKPMKILHYWVDKITTTWCNKHFKIRITVFIYNLNNLFHLWIYRPFHFSISENHSNVSLFSGPDEEIENYKSLLQVPTKANNDYYTLDDVIANGQNLHGEHINLLAVVKKVKKIVYTFIKFEC